jgi:hypothetical protein
MILEHGLLLRQRELIYLEYIDMFEGLQFDCYENTIMDNYLLINYCVTALLFNSS